MMCHYQMDERGKHGSVLYISYRGRNCCGFFEVIEWATVGWVILGLFILNGVIAWGNAKAQVS